MLKRMLLLGLLTLPNFIFGQITGYQYRKINGFEVYIQLDAINNQRQQTDQAIDLLTSSLDEINRFGLNKKILDSLQAIKIFMDGKTTTGGAVYHASQQWLKDNGYIPEKWRSVEISNIANFNQWSKLNQPYIVLHELAHAYHDRVLNFSNTAVSMAYSNALAKSLYGPVSYHNGNGQYITREAYARTNIIEYFAELTEAYLGKNDYFPFIRKELQAYDSDGYHLMLSVWQFDLDCSNAIPVIPGKTIEASTADSKTNVSTYNNDPWWQLTGPENVHRLDWPGGDLSIKLSNKSAALDLILLRSCNNNDFITSGGGNSGTSESTINLFLDPGTYYIIVDGWQQAKGSYRLLVRSNVTVGINSVNRTFFQSQDTLYEQLSTGIKVMATGVEELTKNWGYVTNTNTGEGQEQVVLSIKKAGQAKPKMFLNENFNTDYLKQKLICPQKSLSLFGDLVFDGGNQILSGCDILRCENGHTLAHQKDSKIKLYSSSGNNNWLDILQMITINSISYYIRQSDFSVWALTGSPIQPKMIGTEARLLQDNDNQLIKIDLQGKYERWNGTDWSPLSPLYTGVSPEMTDEGFWFFIQPKAMLDLPNGPVNHKGGLTYDNKDLLIIEPIPASGNCDRFLWRTKETGGGKRILINKAKGEQDPLLMSSGGIAGFVAGQGVKEWEIKYSDKTRYGTNAFQLLGSLSTKALSWNSNVVSETPTSGTPSQTWVFQFNQMVRDYFLPIPTRKNLEMHYVDNPNVNLNTAADAITATYNKFLKGANGVTFFATNTGSDWVIVNYYVVINNMMNAVISPKPSDPKVNPSLVKTLDAMKGQSLILINKNDLNSAVPNQYFTAGFNSFSVASLRGSSGYLQPRKWILVSEELTGKTGIVNRPLDRSFRRFDHGVHEFGHALQQLCGWIPIVDANNMCDAEKGRSSECFCYDIQNWFNSVGSNPAYSYPGIRATPWFQSPTITSDQRSTFMKKIFNEANTWMPPADLRLDGYNPSGSHLISTSAKNFTQNYSIRTFPNPFSQVLHVELKLKEPQHIDFEISDVTGKVLRTIKSNQFTDMHRLQLQDLDYQGILFIKIKSRGFYGISKVLKIG